MIDGRHKWRVGYSILLLITFIFVVMGIGYMWYEDKDIPEALAGIVGALVLAIINEVKAVGNFLFGEAALGFLYKGVKDEDDS